MSFTPKEIKRAYSKSLKKYNYVKNRIIKAKKSSAEKKGIVYTKIFTKEEVDAYNSELNRKK